MTRVSHLLKGQPRSQSAFGDDVAEVTLTRRENYIELAFLDDSGQPAEDSAGVEVVRLRFDGSGTWLTRLQLRADGTVCADSYGVVLYSESLSRATFGSREIYLDTTSSVGKHTTMSKVAIRGGGWETRREYDSSWRCLRSEIRGESGQRMNDEQGICERVYAYDPRQNPISAYYYDSSGHKAQDSSGAYGHWSSYDPRGYLVRVVCVDSTGRPGLDRWGVGMRTAAYDGAGLCTSITNYGAVDRLAEDRDGIAIARRLYDSAGRVIELAYLGAGGAPRNHPEWGARVVVDYDTSGGAEYHSYDEGGQPHDCRRFGAAVVRSAYSERASAWVTTYLDPAGRLVRVDTSADEGRSLVVTYPAARGKPSIGSGFHGSRLLVQRMDQYGRMTDIELRD